MAATWKTMTYFALTLPNRPGELGRFTKGLADAKINLVGLWGYAEGQDEPRLSCVPASPDAFRKYAAKARLKVEEGKTFYCSGEDRPGALVETMRRIGEAGINIDAIETVAAGERFGCFVWAEERHWPALEKLLA
jgi:hypothetical protein